ncbi:hypothetical protein H696_01260 [Fonticula alba]|uniref:Brix domain-containing protein n=1 Tax=Fonticula alba TaxID=691883 RepID=A0A058ZD35_FONAL|nr:hypothetical protein H696_01260 [Fonticula alba]KCV71843.1 hypothetical protein H696_01260 [Fonticula alba]|eukprot:XP_009493421.1 hypothetical protein H696_01260 [Fonticula alba]
MFHPSYAPPVPLDLESGAERKSAPAGTVLPSLAGRLPPEFFERQHFTDEQKLLWDELVDIVEQMFTLPKIPPRLTGRLHQIVFRITGIFDLDRLQTNVRERQASLRFMVLCLVETHLKKILAQLEAAPDADLLQELTRSWTQLLSILSSLGFAMAPVHDVISPSRLYRINFIFNDTITTLKLLLPPALLDRISNRILLELIDVRHKNEPFDFNHFSLMVDFLRILDKHSTDIEDRDILPLPAPPSRSPLRARLFEEHFLSTTSAYLKEQHSLICSAEPSVYFSKVLEIFRKEEEKFILLMPETIKDLEWMVINIFFPNMQQMLDFLFDTLCRVGPCNDAVTLIRLLAFQPESEEPTKQRVEAWMHQLCVKTCTPFVDNFAAVRRDPQELLIAMYDVYQGATSGMNSVPIEEIKIAVPKTFGHFINEVAFSPRGLFSQSPDCSFAILVAVALDRYIRTFPTGSPLPPEHLNNGDPLSKQKNPNEIGNKIKRQQVYRLQKAERKKAKEEKRKRSREEAAELGENAPAKKIPKTQDSEREHDPTTVTETQDEVEQDKLTDEFADYYNSQRKPKILITTSKKPVGNTFKFIDELQSVLPDAHFYARKGYKMQEIIKFANMRNFTDLMVIHEENKEPDTITMMHLPYGPTAHFRISNIKLSSEITGHGTPTSHSPEIILSNFTTRLGHSISRMVGCLFPHEPGYRGRQVVTLRNQRDYIFFRRHRYIFEDEGTKARLQELGPRFTLRLQWLQKGTLDSRFGDFEWHHRSEMDTSRRRFFL